MQAKIFGEYPPWSAVINATYQDWPRVPDDVAQQIVALLPRLRRFAYSLTGSLDAGDDLVQAACERALSRIDQWKPGTRLDSWMFRIVQTIWIDTRRASSVRGEVSSTDDLASIAGEDGRQVVESSLTLAEVRAAIARLPVDQRAVLSCVAIDGQSYKQAAATLGIPIGTVMSRLARARRKLDDDLHGKTKLTEDESTRSRTR